MPTTAKTLKQHIIDTATTHGWTEEDLSSHSLRISAISNVYLSTAPDDKWSLKEAIPNAGLKAVDRFEGEEDIHLLINWWHQEVRFRDGDDKETIEIITAQSLMAHLFRDIPSGLPLETIFVVES